MTQIYKTTVTLYPPDGQQSTYASGADFGVIMDTSPTAQTAVLLNEVISPLFDVCQTRQPSGTHKADSSFWVVEGYSQSPPDSPLLNTLIQGVAVVRHLDSIPSVATELLPETDWVADNQKSFPPKSIGRFYIHATDYEGSIPVGKTPLIVNAGNAFGTGGHGTTMGCLQALSDLAKTQTFTKGLDIGTGTGILALAMAKTWRKCSVLATDIDPIAIDVTRYNLMLNRCRWGALGVGATLQTAVAKGVQGRIVSSRNPYDIMVANILATPLRQMAVPLTQCLSVGGFVVLSGLLSHQVKGVRNAYQRLGLKVRKQYAYDGWHTLVFQKS